jgi:hypothetical protein
MFPSGNKPEMFRFAQFATGRIRRGGHDSVTYETTVRRRILFLARMHILDFGFPILHYA